MRAGLRGAFLLLALAFLGWGLRGRGDEIADAVAAVPPAALAGSVTLITVGLVLTSLVWRRLLLGFAADPPARAANAIFFVGQLGKYIPGSVWSIGAQAELGRSQRLPPRVTATTSLVFLAVNLATAVLVTGTARLAGAWSGEVPTLAGVLAVAAALTSLAPGVVGRLATYVAKQPFEITLSALIRVVVLMLLVWTLYGVGLLLLAPTASIDSLVLMVGAFALAYAVGVVVVIAPAGAGAREAVLIAVLAPTLGVPQAAATALLVRVVHTVADLALAGVAWTVVRRSRRVDVSGEPLLRR